MESAAVPTPEMPIAGKLLHLTDRPVLVVPAEER
jgi:hypothetical protein